MFKARHHIFDEETLIALYVIKRFIGTPSLFRRSKPGGRRVHPLLERVAGKPLTGNIRAYLYRVAHNWVVDHYRQEKPQADLEAQPLPANANQKIASLKRKTRLACVKRCWHCRKDQRLVIELQVMEKWLEAVADVLGKSVEASRALQYRALKITKIFSQWM